MKTNYSHLDLLMVSRHVLYHACHTVRGRTIVLSEHGIYMVQTCLYTVGRIPDARRWLRVRAATVMGVSLTRSELQVRLAGHVMQCHGLGPYRRRPPCHPAGPFQIGPTLVVAQSELARAPPGVTDFMASKFENFLDTSRSPARARATFGQHGRMAGRRRRRRRVRDVDAERDSTDR
jgi:hypothetical protein